MATALDFFIGFCCEIAPINISPTPVSGFELISSLETNNHIPVHEFKSRRTGLTIVLAEVDGPVVSGYFCLVTEAHDDDGLPHTLEHLIFLGSEQYPYKGVLDLLANRCLASGTNAWTDIDHTSYTMATAGSEGFLSLMPIYLEHILYPTLTEQAFLTEVHHITEKGEDAGVVYCEMQGRENSGESRAYRSMMRAMYPGNCGYSSETGGIMKNLRESTTIEKIRNYHKDFYRPENLKVLITGQVKPEDVFKALEDLEEKIVSKGERPPFTRPWLNTVPPLLESLDQEVKYPCDEETNGIVLVSWRGPSAVTEQYMMSATSIILKYLTDYSVAPLQKEFVEITDPYASKVAYGLHEQSESLLCLEFKNVPKEKLTLVKPRLLDVLKNIATNEDIDMDRLRCLIHRCKLESLSALENNPHDTVAFMVIGHMLYGNSTEDLKQRLNPVISLEKMESEPKSFWIALINKYFVEANVISICGVPSIEEKLKMAEEEKQRIEAQIATLTAVGLEQKGTELKNAIAFNEKPPPNSMLTSVPIPGTESINFHEIVRSSSLQGGNMDLSSTPVSTYFDHVNTNFVYMFVLMDTSQVPLELRLYLPLLLEAFLESPVKRGNTVVSYEDIVSELESDTVATVNNIGLGISGRFSCGSYSHTASIMLQVEEVKYKRGINWLRELLYQTQFTAERLQIIATKMVNDVSRIKRMGGKVASDLMESLCYVKDSNQYTNSMLRQQKFLTDLLENLKTKPNEILENIEKLRKIITDPSNMVLYLAANTNHITDWSVEVLDGLLPPEITKARVCLNVTPDSRLIALQTEAKNCVVGMGCIESSFMYHITPSISTFDDPDVPVLMTYLQYITQLEGPLWKQVRGKGFAYHYNIWLNATEGLLYLMFYRATNVMAAFREAQDIVTKQITSKTWDQTLLESAKSSLISEIVMNEKTIGHVVGQSLVSYFEKVDYSYNRGLVSSIKNVTEADLNRVGEKYVAPLFDPAKTRTTIVCHPDKTEEIVIGFKEMNFSLEVVPSLEKSILNEW